MVKRGENAFFFISVLSLLKAEGFLPCAVRLKELRGRETAVTPRWRLTAGFHPLPGGSQIILTDVSAGSKAILNDNAHRAESSRGRW